MVTAWRALSPALRKGVQEALLVKLFWIVSCPGPAGIQKMPRPNPHTGPSEAATREVVRPKGTLLIDGDQILGSSCVRS